MATPATTKPVPIPTSVLCAAEMLEGVELANGWKVRRKSFQEQPQPEGTFPSPIWLKELTATKRSTPS